MTANVVFPLFCLIAIFIKDLESSPTCMNDGTSFVCRSIKTRQDFPSSVPLYTQRVTLDGRDFPANVFPNGLFADASWRNLTELVIVDFQHILDLNKTFLEGLDGLKYFSVLSCSRINYIDSAVFQNTPKLEALQLYMIWWMYLYDVEKALTGTPSGLKYLSLIGLHMRRLPIVLGKSFSNALSGRNLTYLDLSLANIIQFEYDVYRKVLFNLRYLNISNTKISLFKGLGTDENDLPEWDVFDASRCPTMVETKQLWESKYFVLSKVKYIFLSTMYEFKLQPDIILNLSRLNALTAINVIDLSNNNLVYINMTLLGAYNFQELQKLDISGNYMEYINPSLLRHFPSMKVLNMTENKLFRMQTTEAFRNLLIWNKELRVLYLRNNNLTTIPKTFLTSNTKLQLLDLRYNNLNDFNIDLSNMWNLRYVDLSNNRLHNLPSSSILFLEVISRYQLSKTESNESYVDHFSSLYFLDKTAVADKYGYGQSFNTTSQMWKNEEVMYRHLTIGLSGNPLQCDCESIYFLEWIISTNIAISQIESLRCTYASDQYPLNRKTLDKVYFDCVIVKVIVTSTSFAFVCISAFSILVFYMKRQKRKRMKIHMLTELIQKGKNKFKFIVFLPFCSQDDDIVRTHIHLSLNNLLKQKLNINIERDLVCCGADYFTPGERIMTEIHRCISESLVVVPVITSSFLKSPWCTTECMVALQEHMNIVVLMQEPIDISGANVVITKLLENYTRGSWAIKEGVFEIRPQWNIIIQSIIDKSMEFVYNHREATDAYTDYPIAAEDENAV
ncbi:hypothetical protein CHS0354_036082 [Potamilus streckersoni]|uniref:TIR domain-containing protein n=1 Tax=Potamilus streckersoni TaxID=2493646 RepID=A0AAE0RY91_9BIVA|nr:hypothetical protein CHS0354_036082 [Potamilus streckersoni]